VDQTLHKLTLTLNNSEKVYEYAIVRKDLRVVLLDGILDVRMQEVGV